MDGRTAIIAGHGSLPATLAQAMDELVFVTFEGMDVVRPEGLDGFTARFDQLGALFDGLKRAHVGRVVFAGAMSRPALDPTRFDPKTMQLAPRLMKAFQKGDDRLLREVVSIFEQEGFEVVGAHEILPAITMEAGTARTDRVSAEQLADADRARAVLAALSPLDVAQSAVCEAGLMLGIETIQGTDFMLDTVTRTPAHLRKGKGVFVKLPKAGQDLRVDMPAIGPETVRAVAAAGLAGIDIAAGRVIVLDQDEVFRLLVEHDIFLIAR